MLQVRHKVAAKEYSQKVTAKANVVTFPSAFFTESGLTLRLPDTGRISLELGNQVTSVAGFVM
jgi:hypothetical protein